MTANRNDSVSILNHWDSLQSDVSASILKSNYAKLLARSILASSKDFGSYRICDQRMLRLACAPTPSRQTIRRLYTQCIEIDEG